MSDLSAVGAVCQLASCGDGYVFTGFEECDDGNATPGDGCTACQLDGAEISSEGGGTSGAVDASGGTSGAVDASGGEAGGDSTGAPTDDSGSSRPVTSGHGRSATGGEGGSRSTGVAADDGDGGGCSWTTDDRRGRGGLWFASVLVPSAFAAVARRRAASRG